MTLAVIGLLSFAFAFGSGPLWISFARKIRLMDHGDGVLKLQQQPVPYFGGPLIVLAAIAALIVAWTPSPALFSLCAATVLAAGFGLLDDVVVLRVGTKLVCQIVLACLLVFTEHPIRLAWFPPLLDLGVTLVWFVAVMNAFNFLDVSDGLCASVSVVLAIVLGAWAVRTSAIEAGFCAALAGAIAGFLPYNWRNARMYLGDSGSMALGVVFAALVPRLCWTNANAAAGIIAPLAVLSTPLFELSFVLVCRLLLSLPLHRGSPDHAAVRLRARSLPAVAIAYWASGATVVGGAGGFLAATGTSGRALVIGLIGVTGWLGLGVWLWRLDPRLAAPRVAAADYVSQEMEVDLGHRVVD